VPYSSRILARVGGFSYDAAGNVLNDNANAYLYDGEGRLCAVKDLTTGGMFEYIYDADGERVIKGTIATFNCNPAGNGFTPTSVYVRGLNGKELTETNGSFQWDHTNVFAGGELLATYKGTDTYFALNDWLGTKRGEATPDGCRATYISLPYGNDLTASGCIPDATEQHFTGKEHDTESGNDYFGARYYNSSTGRFLSPDWSAIPAAVHYADLTNPQSLNLYEYVGNNPLSKVDPNGHCGSSNSPADWMCHNGFGQLAQAAYGAFGYGGHSGRNQAQQQVSQQGQDFIKGYEQLRLAPYDANPGHGDMTIGYGHKIKKGETFGTITKGHAESLFAADVSTMAAHVSADLRVGVTQNQFDALVSLRFNAGPFAVTPPVSDLNSTGHATMSDFTQHYITMGGVFSQGLANRRAAEWNIFSKGMYDSTH